MAVVGLRFILKSAFFKAFWDFQLCHFALRLKINYVYSPNIQRFLSMVLIRFALIMLYLDEKVMGQTNVFHISPAKLCKFCTHKYDFQLKNSIYFVLAYIHPKQKEKHQINVSGATLFAL